MTQYIVTNEHEADEVVDIIRRMTHDEGSKELPKEVTVFVPSAKFKAWFYHNINDVMMKDPDCKNQRLLFKLGVVCPEEMRGIDEGEFDGSV